ncbi:MAG: hypothetical protein R6U61_08405 [Thermoplasmata archaeon]
MCRYKYGNNRCAHPKNFSIECVGEEKCEFREEQITLGKIEETNIPQNSFSENEKQDEHGSGCAGCSHTVCGIFCQKYGRFYCAGQENCETEGEYLEHLNLHGGVE